MIFARKKKAAHTAAGTAESPDAFRPQNQGPGQGQGIQVSPQEAGLKLIGLLERRLLLPPTLLHRWIRTGQIRLNGSRAQPFARVSAGDSIRVPPFAGALSEQARATKNRQEAGKARREGHHDGQHGSFGQTRDHAGSHKGSHAACQPARTTRLPLSVLDEDDDYMALFKPAGLPTQPGTGHQDSVATRLKEGAQTGFAPQPVHRLDKDTTGLVLAAKNYQALKRAHDALREGDGLGKEYLAWVHGIWPHQKERLVKNWLRKGLVAGQEKMLVRDEPHEGHKEALLVARPVKYAKDATLLQIRLLTGRTHQIRAQLSHLGFPLLGDGKYGRKDGESLMLHALRLTLPEGKSYLALPRWRAPYGVEDIPAPMDARPKA